MTDENQQNQNNDPEDKRPEESSGNDWGMGKATEPKKTDEEGEDPSSENNESEEDVETQGLASQDNKQIEKFTPEPVKNQEKTTNTPKKIGKDKSKAKSNAKFLVIMALSFAALFIVFIILMVLVIAQGGENSPVLQAFGINASGIKSFLLAVVNISFSLLGLLFFVIGVIGVFRILFAKKDDKETRKKGIRMSIIGAIPLIIVMFTWLFLYNYISTIKIIKSVKAEILVVKPDSLKDLEAPLTVTFSSRNAIQSLRNNGFKVKDVSWDFNGDGDYETVATDFEMSYLYNLRGNYNVGLKIDAAKGEAHKYYKTITIGNAIFEATPDTGTAPLKVSFDATKLIPKGAKIQSLDWDFDGDGTYDKTGKQNTKVEYTFKTIGTHKVHLRFVDANNLVENFYRDIKVTKSGTPLLSAVIKATPGLTGKPPLQILFDGKGSKSLKGKIVNYEWDLGDGSKGQSGASVSHTYNKVGTYTVKLTVKEDTGNTDAVTVKVELKEEASKPKAVISTKPALVKNVLKGDVPLKVSFDAADSTDANKDIVGYEWSIDGNKKVGSAIDYTFEKTGTYTVTLKVTDADKNEGSTSITVKAEKPGTKAVIKATPESGTVPLTVSFDGSSSTAFKEDIVGYEWDFGDGSAKSVTGALITHKYDKVGSYKATLKVTTSSNSSNATTKTIYVRETAMKACFTSSRDKGPAPFSVTFDAKCSAGTIDKYLWDFGDGGTSTARKPSYTFEDPGTYKVKLEVSDSKNNVSTFIDTVVAEDAE